MLNSRYFFLPALALFLAASLGLAAGSEQMKATLFLLVYLPLFASSILSRLIFHQRKKFGHLYYALCCVTLFLLLIMSWVNPAALPFFIPSVVISWAFIVSTLFVLISFLVAVPTTIIPYSRHLYARHILKLEQAGPSFNVEFVNLRFDNIKQKFKVVESAVR